MKKIFLNILSFFNINIKKDKNNSIKIEDIKEIREYLPQDFLNFALDKIIYTRCVFEYKKEDWKVTNCYFAGATLCLDLENEKYKVKDVITICSDNTFGLFIHSNVCKRSHLLQEEINKVNTLRKRFNKKEYN